MNMITVTENKEKHSSCNSCYSYESVKSIAFVNYDSRGNSSSTVIKLCKDCAETLKSKL